MNRLYYGKSMIFKWIRRIIAINYDDCTYFGLISGPIPG